VLLPIWAVNVILALLAILGLHLSDCSAFGKHWIIEFDLVKSSWGISEVWGKSPKGAWKNPAQ